MNKPIYKTLLQFSAIMWIVLVMRHDRELVSVFYALAAFVCLVTANDL